MSKKLFNILIILFVILIIASCKDVLESDSNVITIEKNGTNGLSNIIEFRFDADFLTFQNDDSTTIWNVNIPFTWAKTFNVVNKSKDTIVHLTDIDLLDGKYFSIYTLNPLPFELFPSQIDPKNLVNIMIKTDKLQPGLYNDKIIINKNKNLGFFIRVKVN